MKINGSLNIINVPTSTSTELLVYNTGTGAVERRSSIPIVLSTRLTNWDAYNANGIVVQTSSTTWANRTITGPASGITITNGNGVSGNPTLALANDLAALEGLASTGFAVRTTTDTWANRTITGTAGQITVTNGNGVSGNPTLALDSTFVSNSSLWQLSGTGTFNVQSTSGYSSITSTGSNNFCFGGTSVGPNTITGAGSNNSVVLGGFSNTASGTYNCIFGGSNNNAAGSVANHIYNSDTCTINGTSSNTSIIINSDTCTLTNTLAGSNVFNTVINCKNITLQNANNTVVIGQTSTVTITESDIVYVGKEIVGGKVATTVLTSALSNTSSTIYSNIISFNAKAGAVYRLRLIGTYQTAATTTGIKVRMSGTAVANVTGYITGAITAATGASSLRATIASMTAELITTGVSVINTPHAIDGDIIVRCTTAGTVILQMASEVNASAAQLNIGTAVIVERVI